MQNSFLTQHTPNLTHPLFGSIVGLLEFFLFLIESFEVVVFLDDGLRSAIELAQRSEIVFSTASLFGTTVFSLPSPFSRVLTALLFLCSLLSFFDSVPFSPTYRW